MTEIKWRKYINDHLLPYPKPLIQGRVDSAYLFYNAHRISQKDFYNFDLTEEDLKQKYGDIRTDPIDQECNRCAEFKNKILAVNQLNNTAILYQNCPLCGKKL